MIQSISQNKYYNSFMCNNIPIEHNSNNVNKQPPPLKVKVGAALGGAVGVLAATCFIARKQSKLQNVKRNILNIIYEEKELLGVAISGVLGGLAGGIITDDKKYVKPKCSEAIHQIVANIICPTILIGTTSRLYKKMVSNIKTPDFINNINNKFVKNTIKVIPNLGITVAGLTGGIFAGNYILNKCKKYTGSEERKVKPIDFIYHPDDIATGLAITDKESVMQKIAGKMIPFVFTICGYETGTKR